MVLASSKYAMNVLTKSAVEVRAVLSRAQVRFCAVRNCTVSAVFHDDVQRLM